MPDWTSKDLYRAIIKRSALYAALAAVGVLILGMVRGDFTLERVLWALGTGAFLFVWFAGGGCLWARYVQRRR